VRSGRALAAVAIVAAASCGTPEYATVGGARVHRPSVAYNNGVTFSVTHARAFPGVFDPRRGRDVDDGTITGRVCNVDVHFDATWYGGHLVLDGRGDVPWKNDFTHTEGMIHLDLDVTELGPGHRRIVGRGYGGIEIDATPERLVGRIGQRRYTLAADGDYLAGRYQRSGDVLKPVDDPYAIYGRQVLGSMVPADEALILILMLTCNGSIVYGQGLVRGFSLVHTSAEHG
jgi:hypothetical protein